MLYLDSLNEKQKEAVLSTNGPLLIVAGAGSGKTKVITHRIIHLIHQGTDPEKILAVTFTNKAAKEMQERVFSLLENREHGNKIKIDNFGNFLGAPHVSTFHSLGVKIIKENSALLGLTRHFSILDENDSLSVIKDTMRELGIDPKTQDPKKIKSIISKEKGNSTTANNYFNHAGSYFQKMVASVWLNYEKKLSKEGALDFDDLLVKAVYLLSSNLDVQKKYQEQWTHIHIDEYQDTNYVQYQMVKLLTGDKKNICVVGDTDQNIYSWRGANIKNMFSFEKDYPGAKIIALEQNYRSTKTIIEAANKIIEKNQYRVPKNLFTENNDGQKVVLRECYNENIESAYIAKEIKKMLSSGVKTSDIAVLYRTNFQSRVLEEAFLEENIPYQVLGVKFFERKEIKDIISYLKASLNRQGLTDIKRIINYPARGIGKVTIAKLFSNLTKKIPPKTMVSVNGFYQILEEIELFSQKNKPSEIIKFIMKKSGIEEELKNGSSDDLDKLENIKELVSLATRYDKMENGLEKLIENSALYGEQDSLLEKNSGVKLMTVHASKGLEFNVVFVSGLEQGLFPLNRDDSKKEDREEERRLFYVAITRAKEKLCLSFSSTRTIFGNKQINVPSEFIHDIPSELIDFEQIYYSKRERTIYIN